MAIQGRKYTSSSSYRYGFNGKENDRETVGTGEGTQDYGFRIYNPSLGRFLSVDPLFQSYPFYTPYQFAANQPIWSIDLDGLENRQKTWVFEVNVIKDQDGNVLNVENSTFGKGTPGAPAQTKFYQTIKEKKENGEFSYSKRELLSEDLVDPLVVKQFGGTANPNYRANLDEQNQKSGITKTDANETMNQSNQPSASGSNAKTKTIESNPTKENIVTIVVVETYSGVFDKADAQERLKSRMSEVTELKNTDYNKAVADKAGIKYVYRPLLIKNKNDNQEYQASNEIPGDQRGLSDNALKDKVKVVEEK